MDEDEQFVYKRGEKRFSKSVVFKKREKNYFDKIVVNYYRLIRCLKREYFG